MPYKVSINTDSYKERRCSERNWEPGTMNDFMHAINGWSVRESNLRELKWRLHYIAGHVPCSIDGETRPIYQEWENKHKKKNYVKYNDRMCGFERTDQVKMYGFAQGYVNIGAVIEKVKKEGSVRIYFKDFYDMRQYVRNMDGCYVEVTKV